MDAFLIYINMKHILIFLTLLTTLFISGCFSPKKFEANHPKKYEKLTNYFVQKGGCLTPIITKVDTLVQWQIKVDTFNYVDTFNFVVDNHDTQIVERRKIIWRDSIRNLTQKIYVQDSSRIVLLSKQLNSKNEQINAQKIKIKNSYIAILIILILLIGSIAIRFIKI